MYRVIVKNENSNNVIISNIQSKERAEALAEKYMGTIVEKGEVK